MGEEEEEEGGYKGGFHHLKTKEWTAIGHVDLTALSNLGTLVSSEYSQNSLKMNAFVHLIEWLFVWHPCKNGLVSQRRMQTSARCGSPEISSAWLSLTSWAWWIWVIYWSCRRVSRRSAQRFVRVYGSNFEHQSPPFLSLINSDLVRKLSTSSRFAFTYIRCYLFFYEKLVGKKMITKKLLRRKE